MTWCKYSLRHHLYKRWGLPGYAVRPAIPALLQAVPSQKPAHSAGSVQLVHLPCALDDGHLRAEPAQTRRLHKQNVVDIPEVCPRSFCVTEALNCLEVVQSWTTPLSDKVTHLAYSVPAWLCFMNLGIL